jgi:hypothetical protein
MVDAIADEEYPDSAVPAAFDRGHLYSPTLDQTRWALKPGYAYDYKPGRDFEPMPDSPRGDGKAWAWWNRNIAMIPAADFLGLRAGDEISLHSLQGNHTPVTVTATYRHHAVVRHPRPEGSTEPYTQTWVNRRNADGHWY